MGLFDGALGGLLGGVASGIFGMSAVDQSVAAQRTMAQNAHQWEVEDLRKAGLNPVLSAGGKGASAPAAPVAPTPDFSGAVSKGTSSALSAQQKEQSKANTALLRTQQLKAAAEIEAQDIANSSSAIDLKRKVSAYDAIDSKDPAGSAMLREWGPLAGPLRTGSTLVSDAGKKISSTIDSLRDPRDTREEVKLLGMSPEEQKKYILQMAKKQQEEAKKRKASSARRVPKSNYHPITYFGGY